jgi:hypothetical protein
MEAKVSMLPVATSLKKFKIFESSTQFMVEACDKHQEEYHIIRIDKKTDVDSGQYHLEDIIKEEIKTFTKKDKERYM